jgi:hypothetical protein
MRKSFLILLIALGMLQCKPTLENDKTYYFYNANVLFRRDVFRNDTLSYLNYETRREISDSTSMERGYKIYGLHHYYKFSNYRDTSFVKHKSYLDSIDYYGKEWFKKEENLDKFWKSSHGWLDSLKIYTIEPVEGTDSLIFRRVHRFYFMLAG